MVSVSTRCDTQPRGTIRPGRRAKDPSSWLLATTCASIAGVRLAVVFHGWCYKTTDAGCPVGTKVIPPIAGLVGAFVLVGLIGILYLMLRARRP